MTPPLELVPLATLLQRCRCREEGAIAELVRRFHASGLAQARAFVRDEHLAEDALQEAFLVALARLDDLAAPLAFPGWFRQIVRTHAIRIGRRRREAELGPEEPSVEEEPAAGVVATETAAEVRRVLARLPAAGRDVTTLFYLESRSVLEVAGELGIPAGTVKRRLHDARRQLRGQLLGAVPAPDDAPQSCRVPPGRGDL